MNEDRPLLFTPLVGQSGAPFPADLFGAAGMVDLPAPLLPTQGINIAIGVDIIEIERVRSVLAHHGKRFLQRVFTEQEIQQCRGKVLKIAGRFAAKEAISKALGTGMHGIAWRELEIVQLSTGRPSVRLYGNASVRAQELGLSAFDVSISDLAVFSIAVAVGVQVESQKK
jgi:holo-[acyl-carrier protein] synthase